MATLTHFGTLSTVTENREGQTHFTVEVALGELTPQAVCVELYADRIDSVEATRVQMTRRDAAPDQHGLTAYTARVPTTREPDDYTARIVPSYAGVNVPLEAAHILWQR